MSTACRDSIPQPPRDPIRIAGDLVRRGDKLSIEGANAIKRLVSAMRDVHKKLDEAGVIALRHAAPPLQVGLHRCWVREGGKGKPKLESLYWDGDDWRWGHDKLIVDERCEPRLASEGAEGTR